MTEQKYYTMEQLASRKGRNARAGLLPLSARMISQLVKAGKFPKPIYFSPRKPMWIAEEIDAYIAALKQQREA